MKNDAIFGQFSDLFCNFQHLHHDYDYHHGFDHDYDHYGAAPPPLERFDKPTKWKSPQQSGRPSAVNNRKTYYDPFFISRPGTSSVFGHGPVKAVSNQAGSGGWRNSIIGSGSRGKVTYRAGNR